MTVSDLDQSFLSARAFNLVRLAFARAVILLSGMDAPDWLLHAVIYCRISRDAQVPAIIPEEEANLANPSP